MNDLTECPNCHAPLKNALIGSNKILSDAKINLINYATSANNQFYCNRCGNQLYDKAILQVESEINNQKNLLRSTARYIPIVSTHHPYKWEYTVLRMITGQSTTGTGFFSDLDSGIADLFGGQSGAYNKKMKGGENLCFEQLRGQALIFGGNAVIACDIDYSEVGTAKGMLMVCMAGTLIKLHNLEVLNQVAMDNIKLLDGYQIKMKELDKLYKEAK